MTIGEFIKKRRTELNLTLEEVGNACGVAKSTVRKWETGFIANMGKEKISAITKVLKISPSVLIKDSIEDYYKAIHGISESDKTKIPVLGYVRAGIPIEAVEEVLDFEEITKEMACQGEYFGLQIKGDSMEPRMKEGDVVIVRKQPAVDNGDVAVVLVNGGDATVKRFYRYETGVQLISINPAYEPLLFSPSEVESKPVTVIGKVVELRAKF